MKWRDLLGRPFRQHGTDERGMDCTTVAEEILRRLGMKPPASNPFRGSAVVGTEIDDYFGSLDAYQLIGRDHRAAKKNGDVVLAKDKMGIPSAMYVLVDDERGTFLTAEHAGGVRAARRLQIADIHAVFRLIQEEPA